MKNLFRLQIDSNRIFGLDILRMLAIVFVVLTHGGQFIPKDWISIYTAMLFDGVGIFFILSGFLIGKILIDVLEKTDFSSRELWYFWSKRWSRTLPNYFFFLLFLLIFFYPQSDVNIYKYFVFTQNINHKPEEFFSWSWSLAIEEWFYLIIALLIFIFQRLQLFSKKRTILLSVILVILCSNILRIIYCMNEGFGISVFENIKYSLVYRFDTIIYGVLAAYIFYYHREFWEHYKKSFFITALLLTAIIYIFGLQYYHEDFRRFSCLAAFTLISLNVMLYLPYLNAIKGISSGISRPITYVSLISYSLYLVNSIVQYSLGMTFEFWDAPRDWLMNHYGFNLKWGYIGTFYFILFCILSLFWAFLQYKYFEVPTTRFLRKFIKN